MGSHTIRAAPGTPTSPRPPERGDDEETALITYSPLDGHLSAWQSLTFHRGLGTLAHLTIQQDQVVALGEQQFTGAEITLLVPLLDHSPYHCPYEVFWAGFAWNTTGEEMRPGPSARSRTRLKLNTMGLDGLTVFHLGSILVARPALRQSLVHTVRARKTRTRRRSGLGGARRMTCCCRRKSRSR